MPNPTPSARRRRRPEPQDKRQRNVAILAAARQGMTFTAIGEQHGISRERVRQIVRAEEKRRGGPHVPTRMEKAEQRRQSVIADLGQPGTTFASVAAHHGLKPETVRSIGKDAVAAAAAGGQPLPPMPTEQPWTKPDPHTLSAGILRALARPDATQQAVAAQLSIPPNRVRSVVYNARRRARRYGLPMPITPNPDPNERRRAILELLAQSDATYASVAEAMKTTATNVRAIARRARDKAVANGDPPPTLPATRKPGARHRPGTTP